jgi:hypothetical protein
MIKLRRMRWAGHQERMGERRNLHTVLGRKARKEETTRKT